MTNITICGRAAILTLRELLTGGSVGARCKFTFSADWNGLTKVAVFSGSGTSADVTLDATGECEIPYETLEIYGGHLWIGVYGTDADTIVKPTVWADAGRIEKGAEPSGLDPEEFTPTLAQQAITAAESALAKAEAVEAAAAAGDYDGAPGVIWYTTAGQINSRIAISTLVGPDGAEPAAGQELISAYDGDVWLYVITEVEASYVVLDVANRVQLKGPKGDTGNTGATGAAGANAVIWSTPEAVHSGSGSANDYFLKSELTGPSGAAFAAGQMIFSGNSCFVYFVSSVEETLVRVDSYRKGIKGDKGDTGNTGATGANAVIWYTTDAPSSRTEFFGGIIAADHLQGPDGAVVAAGQMIVSSATGKAYWAAGPVEDGAVPLELYEITIAAT